MDPFADPDPYRRLTSEAIVLAGGGTAILLQLAHPAVAAGVARYSDFAAAPMRRLWGTLDFVTAITFGNADDRAFVTRLVTSQHGRVNGEDAVGRRYDANDPEAQRWVAATLCWSAMRAHRRAFGRRKAGNADVIVRGFGALATSLGMPASLWPQGAGEFDCYFRDTLGHLEITPDALRARDELFTARNASWWLRALMPLATRLAVDLLPGDIAAAYGHPHSRVSRFQAALGWAPLVLASRALPRAARILPGRIVLARLRQRIRLLETRASRPDTPATAH